jgi:FkbM family methyltransferase
VGAFDGVQCDPIIHYIDKYNWKGVMLEPQPVPFAKLKERYNHNKRIAIRNAAISPSTGKTVLYTLDGDDLPSWSKGMASFNRENILKHNYLFPDINNRIKEIEVDTIAFEHLLKEESISTLDLLQIDTEGYDAEIIKMFPFDTVKPKIIHFESKHISKSSLENVLDLLISLDYKIARDGEEDMMAVL